MRAGLALAATALVVSARIRSQRGMAEWPRKTNSFARWEEDGAKDRREQAASTVTGRRRLRQGEQPTRPFRASAGPL